MCRLLNNSATADDSVNDNDVREVTDEEVANFVKCIERNFVHYFRIYIEVC